MAPSEYENGLEEQMGQWRNYLRHRQSISNVDIEELEDHLRNQILALVGTGLTSDEAFLVAVKRMGDMDTLTREFAREHSARLWKQLVAPSSASDGDPDKEARSEFVVLVGLAVIAALAVKLPELFGGPTIDDDFGFYARNFSLFILPLLTGYFAWKRKLDPVTRRWLLVPFALAIIFANVFPFTPGGSTLLLTALHLPIALWLAVGIAYAGGRWSSSGGRMDFIRFSGELFIYYVLIAFGGFVLILFTFSMFAAIGLNVEWLVGSWLVPCGALGAVIIGAWLVEAKQSVVENMAPVLTRLFTPLFAVVLLAFLATMGVTGRGIDLDRDALIGFDLILALVLGLLLYSIAARDPLAKPDIFDDFAGSVGDQRPDRRCPRLGGDCCAHFGIRLQPKQSGRSGREHHPAGKPGVVSATLRALPCWPPRCVRCLGALADRLPARVRYLGGFCRHRLPTALRLRLKLQPAMVDGINKFPKGRAPSPGQKKWIGRFGVARREPEWRCFFRSRWLPGRAFSP